MAHNAACARLANTPCVDGAVHYQYANHAAYNKKLCVHRACHEQNTCMLFTITLRTHRVIHTTRLRCILWKQTNAQTQTDTRHTHVVCNMNKTRRQTDITHTCHV